jgi:hypothetical protein
MERSVDKGEGRRIDGQGVKVVVDGAEEKEMKVDDEEESGGGDALMFVTVSEGLRVRHAGYRDGTFQ